MSKNKLFFLKNKRVIVKLNFLKINIKEQHIVYHKFTSIHIAYTRNSTWPRRYPVAITLKRLYNYGDGSQHQVNSIYTYIVIKMFLLLL